MFNFKILLFGLTQLKIIKILLIGFVLSTITIVVVIRKFQGQKLNQSSSSSQVVIMAIVNQNQERVHWTTMVQIIKQMKLVTHQNIITLDFHYLTTMVKRKLLI